MASGRAADREDPQNSGRRAARSLDRDPTSELHQGQRSDAPHRRAGHMTAPDNFAETLLNILRRRGPFSNRISVVNCILIASVAAPGSRFSPRSERSAATSGSKRGRCNVHSGLAWCFTQPKALRRSRLHPRPVGQSPIRGDAWMDPGEGIVRRPPAARTSGMAPPTATCYAESRQVFGQAPRAPYRHLIAWQSTGPSPSGLKPA